MDSTTKAKRRKKYTSGECYVFAQALQRMTGWKAVIFFAGKHPVHAALIHPQGGYVDAAGRVSLDVLQARYAAPDLYEGNKLSADDLEYWGGGFPEEIADATVAIRGYAKRGDLFFAQIVESFDSRQKAQ